MAKKDRWTSAIKFNTALYLAKNKRPYTEFVDLLTLQEKMEQERLIYVAMTAGANLNAAL